MVEPVPQRLSLPPLAGRVLGVEFCRVGDRFAHAIIVSQGDRLWQRLESVEGTNQDLWPPSPALQQLNIQRIANDREAALLVGMAGKSHFSLSVTAEPELHQIVFDAACNYKLPPAFLGSTYEVAEPNDQAEQIQFRFDDRLPTRLQAGDNDESIRLMPDLALADAPALGRWCYRIGLQDL